MRNPTRRTLFGTMLLAASAGRIELSRNKPVRVEDGRGVEVSVVHGSVWITQHRDPNDICLGAGESFCIDRDGATMVDPLKPSLVTLTLPAGRDRALRVSMVAAGAEPFETGVRSKPGSFDTWLDWFRVRPLTASARPTTAAV